MKVCYLSSLISFMALFSGLCAETNAYQWGSVNGGIQMSIGLENCGSKIMTNQPIALMIRIKNLSSEKAVTFKKWVCVEIFKTNSSTPLFSKTGNEPDFSVTKDGVGSGSVTSATVPTKGIYECKFYVGRFKEYSSNEVYKIVVKRKTDQGVILTSNPLYFKVVPGKWEYSNPNIVFP